MNGPRQKSSCLAALVEYAREKKWKFSTVPIPCATLGLPDSWDNYLSILEPRFRTKVRSSLALLRKSIKVNPTRCRFQCDELDEIGSPLLFDLHTRRWAGEDLPGVFRDPAKRNFYHDISRASLEQGLVSVSSAGLGERPLALQYGLIYNNSFHLLQAQGLTFILTFRQYDPVLLSWSLADAALD